MLLPRFFYLLFPCTIIVLFVVGIKDAIFPLTSSFFAAYLTFPIIVKLEKFKMGRTLATSLMLLTLIVFSLLCLSILIPSLISQASDFFHALPSVAARSISHIKDKITELGIDLQIDEATLVLLAKKYGSTVGLNAIQSITTFFSKTFSGVSNGIIGLINFFLFPIFFFYVIRDYEHIEKSFWNFIPPEWRPHLEQIWRDCNQVFSAFIRGQLIVACILGVCYAIGLSLLNVKFGIIIGLATGVLCLIPYVGFTLGLVTSIGVSLAYGGGFGPTLAIAAMYFVMQGIEGMIITPKIVGDRVGLSPLPTMLVIIVGGNLGGLLGMFLAIPAGGVIKRLIGNYRDSLHRNFSKIIK